MRLARRHDQRLAFLETQLTGNVEPFLDAISALPPSVAIFGGGADTDDLNQPSYIFDKEAIMNEGFVIMLFRGTVKVLTRSVLGWQPLGRQVTITAMDGNMVIKELDHIAVNFYEKYLKIDPSVDFDKKTLKEFREQTGGKFYIDRPGKIRFNYEDPSPMRVIADGKSVVIGNRKLKTWDIYPLSKTPLNPLLGNKIDLSAKMVRGVKEEADLTTIVLGDKNMFGDSTITMMFDPKTYDLRQWTITDAQGKDTSVMIFNVKTGVPLDEKVFSIPYDEIRNRGGK